MIYQGLARAAFLALFIPGVAAADPRFADLVAVAAKISKPEKVVLSNGLRVIVEHDGRVPLVAVALQFEVGAKDELPEERGVAHVASRAWTEGGRHFRQGDYEHSLDEVGATRWQGESGPDSTMFSMLVPKNALATPLWFWSDAMAWGADSVEDGEITDARAVALAETKEAWERRPGQCAYSHRDSAVFPTGHPYHVGLFLRPDPVERVESAQVRAFMHRFFNPENAVLSFVGDVTLDDAKAIAAKYFGGIPRGNGPRPVRVAALPARTRESRIEMVARMDHARVILSWLTPPRFAVGDAELDVLASEWVGAVSTKLGDALVGGAHVASDVHATQYSKQLGSVFSVVIDGAPGVSGDAIVRAFDRWAAGITEANDAGLTRVERAFLGRKLLDHDDVLTRARRYPSYESMTGSSDSVATAMMLYALSATQVQAAFSTYLTPERRVTLIVSPSETASFCGDLVKPSLATEEK